MGAGFTGRANSALPVGDPGLPLPEAVKAVEDWYRRRDLRPMIVLPQGAGPDPLPAYLAERSWLPRPGPRALPPVRLPRLAPVPLHACALSETRRRGVGTDTAFSLRL